MKKDLKDIFGTVTGLDDRSIQFLTDALSKNNLPGFDYLEYKQSLSALVGMNMDEETAFKSAFATASTMGLTKEKLLKTASHYKTVLDREKSQFDAALEKQLQQRVEGKRQEVEKLKKQVEEYKQKIEQLQAQIERSQSTIDNADDNIQSALERIQSTKSNFEHTLQSIKNQIDKDIENINSYI